MTNFCLNYSTTIQNETWNLYHTDLKLCSTTAENITHTHTRVVSILIRIKNNPTLASGLLKRSTSSRDAIRQKGLHFIVFRCMTEAR